MEFRKIIGFGKSSFVVSLPKAWVQQNNLRKGDSIMVETTINSLTLKAQENAIPEVPKKIVITTDKKDIHRIHAEIHAAYLAGYDIIKIIGEDLRPYATVLKQTLHNLTGIEVLEQDKNKIVAKELLNPQEISIPVILRRIDNIVRSMFIDTLEEEHYANIAERDLDVNRLVFLVYRIVNAAMDNPSLIAKLCMTYREIKRHSKVSNYIETIGDYIKRIARNVARAKLSEKEKQKVKEVFDQLQKDYLIVMKAFHTNDIELAYDVALHYKERMKECGALHPFIKDTASSEIVYNMQATCSAISHIASALTVEA